MLRFWSVILAFVVAALEGWHNLTRQPVPVRSAQIGPGRSASTTPRPR
ncbi:MAG: hypothetical protein ACKVPY_00345 [Paracoccaceae bacterium]